MKKIALPMATMVSLLAQSALATAALAQSGGPAGEDVQASEDIVVTARRREERLQDVPIAVSAVDAAALNSRGLDNVTQVSQIAPNIQFTPGQGGNSGGIAPFIRGVGENDFIITSDPAVGVYIDGVYVARTFGAMTELLGIDRIEVLRGPQGTLFGKNTVGGAINIVSSVPGQEQRVETDLRYGSFNTVRARAYVETPLSDSWSLGVAALGEFGEGWQNIPSGDNLGNRNVVGGKLALHYKGATIDALLQADGLRRRQHSAPHSMVAFTPTFLSGLQSAFIAPCCTVPGDIDRTDSTAALNKDETDAFNSSLTLTADVGPATLKSITAYRHVDALFGRDGDASSTVNYAGDIHDEQARQISQELQLSLDLGGRGALLLGAFAYREKTRDNTRLVVADGLYPRLIAAGFDPALATALDFNIDFRNRQRTDNLALFANGNYEILDNLSLELGARYTWEKKRFTQSATRIYANQPLLAGTPSYTLEKSWDAFTPRASLSYKVRPNLLTYASFSKGFRSGGFNGRPTSLEEIGSYDPEHLTAYEAGVKAGFGRIATINLAVFRNAYRDQQILVSTVSPATGLIVVRNENAGRSRIQGIELEGNFRVSRHFTLTSALGLLDAKYLSYMSVINGVPTDVSNRSLKQAPDITANASAVYQAALTEALEGLVRVDVAYKSAVFVDAENTPLLRQPDHAIVNASAELRLTDCGLSLRAGVDNLTNRRIITAGYDASTSFGFTEAYYSPPRRYSLTLAWRR
ncbi:TonB-dependent receptor [Sphingobium sp. 3R8]|uniref:TonB-dependent receptor n=1 Tax=Sphingobium sp. 3R8 TaxID=2874921 RepID=UPI001CCAFB73|nr:TonB-dependent receptor [Sphingobium sp. 3R8]MBZ9648289.1 TonB-dependent receptor [Sphingobium sp. 3R8]